MFSFSRKAKAVSNEILSELGQHSNYTPDYWQLELQKYCLVFVVDEMMSGHRSHALLKNEDVLPDKMVAYTHRKFSMFRKELGKASYPVVLPPVDDRPGQIARTTLLPVKGELYIVRPWILKELDSYKENGRVFRRERVFLDIPTRSVEERDGQRILGMWEHHKTRDAWMHIANPEYFFWNNYTDNGSFTPIKPKVPEDRNLSPFYHFSTKDDVK